MLEILQYAFFQKAIIGGILISCIASILGVFIVMRKEANVTHSIANFLFLGVAVSLLFHGNYYLFAFLFSLLGSVLIFFIEKTRFITKESTKEIIAQTGISGGIFITGLLGNLTLDINNFLFGSILFITLGDLLLLGVGAVILYICFFIFGKKFLRIILNEDLARSQGLHVDIYNFMFLVFLSLFIALSVKIFGILLIGAFLIIPANTAKVLAPNLAAAFVISFFLSILSVLIGLFGSYYLDTSSGATIVLTLLIFFIISIFIKKK
ncbi:MAG: metal ABC transporter permease [Candidatus Gracilibacteria bacterium]|nr:metal ABC transporter permease [Candidatus Gracilibacteria bacterium]